MRRGLITGTLATLLGLGCYHQDGERCEAAADCVGSVCSSGSSVPAPDGGTRDCNYEYCSRRCDTDDDCVPGWTCEVFGPFPEGSRFCEDPEPICR